MSKLSLAGATLSLAYDSATAFAADPTTGISLESSLWASAGTVKSPGWRYVAARVRAEGRIRARELFRARRRLAALQAVAGQ